MNVLKLKWFLFAILWLYVVLRAYTVPITHDEAYSFLLIKTNYIRAMGGTANTHWLNSLGMKLGSLLLGDHPWQLRLFSVAAWLLYGFSAIRISEKIKPRSLGFALFVAMVANPYLLDFFSLARGYGLVCAFVLACIWKTGDALSTGTWKPMAWMPALVFASLAVFSNYSSFYFFLGFIISFLLFALINKEWRHFWPLRANAWWWLLILGTSTIAVSNLLIIKLYTGDLEYGGDTDLIGSILGSLVRGSLYNSANDTIVRFITGVVALLLFGCFAYAAYGYWRSRTVSPFIFLSLVVALMLGLNVFFHLAFATPYLLTRTTLIFYPCIVLLFFYLIDQVSLPAASATFFTLAFSMIITVLFSYVFIKSFNLQYCYEWKEQADTGKCLDILAEKKAKKVLLQKWHAGVFINYYSVADKSKYDFQIRTFQPQEAVTLTQAFCDTLQHYDHAILLPPYNLQDMRNKGLSFTVLKQFPITGAAVLEIAKTN